MESSKLQRVHPNDIEVATGIATNMVTKWGLSSLGPLKYGEDDTNPFLGKSAAMQKNLWR